MAQVIVTESSLENIAGAIRSKLGTQDTYKPSEMAGAIAQIHGDPVLEALDVRANGTYTPSSGKDGFSQAVVNVPNSYSSGDEGKVVSGGALVAQSSQSITQNGTYDTTLKNQAIVNVPNSYSASDEGKVVDNGALVAQGSQTITQNGIYDTTLKNQVTVNVSGGGGGGILYTNSAVYESDVQITDVTGFTKVYNTSVRYGNYGSKVSARLDVTSESAIETFMQGGWNANGMAYYDAESLIGAYGGYDFGEELIITKVKLWIGRYSGQNKTLYVTLQWLDENGDWNDVVQNDLEVTIALSYPVNVFECTINLPCYGIRWIHKNAPSKSSNNNLIFAGMTLYEGSGSTIDVYVPTQTGLIQIPEGYDGFGALYIPS